MARVRLIHWNGPEGRERARQLQAMGHDAQFDDAEGPSLLRGIRAAQPDAVVIDLSRLPSHGREAALALRTSKVTRHLPLVFADGDPEKVATLRTLLPDATYTSWSRLGPAIDKALTRRVAAPVVPPPSIYSTRPLAAKLGIKAGMRVGLAGAPKGFAGTLAPPEGTTFTARPSTECDLVLVFVRSQRELVTQLQQLSRVVSRQTLWCIWPKTTSGVSSDLTGNVVRDTGLGSGWVDFKVCSVDDTWSGLAFKRRA